MGVHRVSSSYQIGILHEIFFPPSDLNWVPQFHPIYGTPQIGLKHIKTRLTRDIARFMDPNFIQ